MWFQQSCKATLLKPNSACVLSCKLATYFKNTFSYEHLWRTASESWTLARNTVAAVHGCWNVAKRIFMWYQNIFLFNQNKFIFNKVYFYDIKIYFHSIKINFYPIKYICIISNIFLFNQNKFLFNKIYLYDIKIYFSSIKTNLH